MTLSNSEYKKNSVWDSLAYYRTRHPFKRGKNPALLVIDAQKYFFNNVSRAFVSDSVSVLPYIESLVNAFNNRGLPVFLTRHVDVEGGPMHRWWGTVMKSTDPMTELIIENGEIIIKHSYDSFYRTNLSKKLKENNIDQLIVCGVQTHLCVSTTVRSAFIRGFNPVVVVDAVASKNRELHNGALLELAHGFAMIATTGEVMACL
ncbi:isochorismatase family cysteine hydrolase [Kosmotoga pacifica]|uniref:Isochorismatase-like domain-containing protein n=1 Tax=Kosmotoga pacifica TaxID=1330330 RepID=A0A0G2Z552_9BACT|nr:isochorismatase family cysteine hydrolase [Kosmotoga pacifica]AKI96682.1 hypothetical protein IX53_01320 [Kosmotoga pacifica]